MSCVSSSAMSQDPLQFFPVERWSELQSAFKQDWPRSVTGYTALKTQKNLIEKGFGYGFKVYCPFGDVWNGMVAINDKDQFYEIIIQCPRDDTQKLEDALKRTKVIDWERSIIIPFAPYHVIECVQRALDCLDNNVRMELLPSKKFVLDKAKMYEDVSLPPNITFDLITTEHNDIDFIDSTWPHRYPNSPRYFEMLISTKSGYGLFEDNKLISWVFFNESGNLLHMYTIESHRKKGFAELLLKLVCNISMEKGDPVCAYCLLTNQKACQLYRKLNFEQSFPVKAAAWCYLNKKVD
ncbi:uncharacterized protein LOC142979978 [Anticarsia gemmatalis]|uniref:uncharacterized protein LOC142979978 n=1 Tax=Anticarsia gemmatalis TaxID=129554 RepID=UPI003F76FBA3